MGRDVSAQGRRGSGRGWPEKVAARRRGGAGEAIARGELRLVAAGIKDERGMGGGLRVWVGVAARPCRPQDIETWRLMMSRVAV